MDLVLMHLHSFYVMVWLRPGKSVHILPYPEYS